MFAANTYDEIIRCEKEVENLEIVVLLFVRPTNQAALDIIREFEYIHYNSGKYCSVYAIGYSNDFAKAKDRCYRKATNVAGVDWYFSDQVFVEFKTIWKGGLNGSTLEKQRLSFCKTIRECGTL